MTIFKRLIVSIIASALLTGLVAVVRYLALFPFGINFDGPDTFFAFLGFLMLLFPVAAFIFLVLLSIYANRKIILRGYEK